jgi:hypothetical protein
MENSLCERTRMQLRETRGIGRPVWRIGAACQISSDVKGAQPVLMQATGKVREKAKA